MILDNGPFRTILVGANGTPESERAVEVAISLAKALDARLFLLGVIAPVSAEAEAEGTGLEAESDAHAMIREQVHQSFGTAQRLGVDAFSEIVDGDPEKVIEAKAENISADLIVVGHRDISRVRRWLEGSTSESLIQGSKTSVLVVHDEQ